MNKTAHQDWIKRRIAAVEEVYEVYDILTENGIEIPDRNIDFQVSCPFHPDRTPSARYYGSGTKRHFHCWSCKSHLGTVALYAKFRKLEFMDGLKELERRFHIKVPQHPDPTAEPPKDKTASDYTSEAWSDIPRVLNILEKKLLRIRDKASLVDYTKCCRVLDAVYWDYDKSHGQTTPEMVKILGKVRDLMDGIINQETLD